MGLDTVELVMAFEEAFEITIPDKAAENMVSVRNVRDFVASEYLRLGRPVDLDDIFRRVREITVAHTNVEPDDVMLDTRFVEDLRMD